MTLQNYQITVSPTTYQQLAAQALRVKMSVNDFAEQVLTRELAVPIEDDLPPQVQEELRAMASLSDAMLWQIAESRMNPDKVALYDLMVERLHADSLTAEGREILAQLREEGELLMLRKAHAYLLLKKRGHSLPTLEEMQSAPLVE